MTTMNYLHLLRHHDVDHFYHYFGNDPETKKKVWSNETLWTTALQLSTVVDNGLIEGY